MRTSAIFLFAVAIAASSRAQEKAEGFDHQPADLRVRQAAERFRVSFYDNPHQFNVKMQEDALEWLSRCLGRP